MLAFRVSINGKLACTAVAGEGLMLVATAKGEELTRRQKVTESLPGHEKLQNLSDQGGNLQVLGTMSSGVALSLWLDSELSAGDVVQLEVIDAAQATPSQPIQLLDRT